MIMLLENVNTECLNFRLATGFDLKPKNNCSWIFLAIDNSRGDSKPATFAIHFGEAWTAKVFKAVVDAVLSELPAGQTTATKEKTTKTLEITIDSALSGLTTVDASALESPMSQVS